MILSTRVLFSVILCLSSFLLQADDSQILATIGDLLVTVDDLDQAMASSPFVAQFNTMDEDNQAALRGDMLKRLITARLFYLEALRLGMDKSASFLQKLEGHRKGLLYRHYMDKLRSKINLPEHLFNNMNQQFKDDPDGFAGAKSMYIAERYRTLQKLTFQTLQEKYKVNVYPERIAEAEPKTVMLEGNAGLIIHYADIVNMAEHSEPPNPAWVEDQLIRRAELLIIAHAADAEGVKVEAKLASFRNERLPAMLLENMEKQWTEEIALRDYFKAHPEIGEVLERRHIGQLVVADPLNAERLRTRIVKGESLFTLAAKYSIDPYGKKHKGDMGWLKKGTGIAKIEKAIADLEDNQVSEIIQTVKGYHLILITERRPGGKKAYTAVRDRVRQVIIMEKLGPYIKELEQRYPVEWKLRIKQ